ncbi:MAG: SsrA-binding protein SmpB [Acholeplasmatales bacterium]|nr:SsrA-binding protein SmpB [Acholeplasmatales bacterium]
MVTVAENRKASHEYFILDTYEAGIKLTGTEIKSIRAHKVNINDSYVIIKDMKVWAINMNIAKYDNGNIFNHDETRARELLLHKHEILKLFNKVKLEGCTIVPLKLYFKDALLKVEIGLCKGKNLHDKREDLKKRDSDMRVRKALKGNY